MVLPQHILMEDSLMWVELRQESAFYLGLVDLLSEMTAVNNIWPFVKESWCVIFSFF